MINPSIWYGGHSDNQSIRLELVIDASLSTISATAIKYYLSLPDSHDDRHDPNKYKEFELTDIEIAYAEDDEWIYIADFPDLTPGRRYNFMLMDGDFGNIFNGKNYSGYPDGKIPFRIELPYTPESFIIETFIPILEF